jgi:eukaryotic-like serine/threonine-protein kinase
VISDQVLNCKPLAIALDSFNARWFFHQAITKKEWIMKIEATSHKLRIIFVVMSAALTFLPAYLSVEAQKQKNVEVQTYTETVNRVGIEMIRVPAGKFTMGSPANEKDRSDNEGPQHIVTVSSFYMGKFEVTQAQWRAVSLLPKVKIDLKSDPAKYKGDNLPVETVSWDESVEFCERLSRATGKSYRLPTEAEWEYACRAGTTGMYAGNLDLMAWYGEDFTKGSTHPVGTKQANRFGLYDMHGNVWEWCQDWYGDNYYAQSPSTNPTGPSTGSVRVSRGGDWLFMAPFSRSAIRDRGAPGNRGGNLGFRLARTYN